MSWQLAPALVKFRAQLDARFPKRDHASDGTIGDARHRAEHSDHNPNRAGYVRAFDGDVDGIPAAALAEDLRKLGAAGDTRLNPGGYVILNGRIASASHGWTWRIYSGDPHRSHFHLSVTTAAAGYKRTGKWNLPSLAPAKPKPAPKPAPAGDRVLRLGDRDLPGKHDVTGAQHALRAAGVDVDVDGIFGPGTERAVRTFQARHGLTVDGIIGPRTLAALRAIVH